MQDTNLIKGILVDMQVASHIGKRILLGIFTIWVISILSFIILSLPEDQAIMKFLEGDMEEIGGMSAYERIKEYLGADKPIHVRYVKWIWPMISKGELGISFEVYNYYHERPVKEMVGDRIWTTIVLVGFTALITWTFAIPVGIYSAVRQHSVGDYVFTFIGFSGLAVPDFLLGLVLMYVALAYLGQSVGGLYSQEYADVSWFQGGFNFAKFRDLIDHLWIPAVVLGTSGTASLIRIMRNNLLDELNKPYVVTARAKGLKSWKVVLKYPVRVAFNPLISTVGYLLPTLVSGSLIVSTVMSLPTLGPVLLRAIERVDMHLAAFLILMYGVLTVIGTLLSDILLSIADPRIKIES